jgi:FKBP-type peptidyl-prolyl cis-trans isomerase
MQQVFKSYQEKMMKKQQEEHEAALKANAEESTKWLAEVEKMEGVQKTESGLLYRIDREGDGKQAVNDEDTVKVNYEGKTRTGKVFDSSYERGEAIEFPLNRVIKGWTEGMKLVKVGGQITLWIPAELAYGERGAGADIGPNEALEFKVELLDVTSAK